MVRFLKSRELELYLTHRTTLIDYATQLVGCRARAEDIVQEAFLHYRVRACASQQAAGAKISLPAPIAHPAAYLYRIVRNLALDWRRRPEAALETIDTARLKELPAATPTPEQTLLGQDRLRVLAEALAELPERTRLAFDMYRLQGRSLQDIAEHLGVSVTRAHQLVKDAIRHGANKLDADD